MADPGRASYLRRLFTIAPTRPFLAVLAEALLSGRLVPGFDRDNPTALADATILVPTRRAARALHLALLDASGRRALLLPQIRPIGDVDDDPFELSGAARLDAAADAGSALAEMPPFARQLALTRLVLAWKRATAAAMVHPVSRRPVEIPATVAEAVHLADALTALMDQVATEGVGWSRLTDLAPADHARYWDLSLAFLKIVTEAWPNLLAERGWEDPGARRDRLIRRAAARLLAAPPAGPVIVAGSTGSVPATAELIRAVAHLPLGAVILPGLDHDLDPDSWAAIGSRDDQVAVGHPQYGLKLLLDRLGADRVHVEALDPEPDPALAARTRLIADAMRPTATTELWVTGAGRPGPDLLPAALAGVCLMEARHEGEEALAIAVALRAALAEGKTAALVTPDRTLARRVSVELGRFGLAVDDSAGQPLAGTSAATLARLVADSVLGDGDAVSLAGLLHHPSIRLGLSTDAVSAAARAVEIMALRGPAPAPGIAGLRSAYAAAEAELAGDGRVPRARRRLSASARAAGRDLLRRLDDAVAGLAAFAARPQARLVDLVPAHAAALAALVADADGGQATFLARPDGAVLVDTLAELAAAAGDPDGDTPLRPADYPSVFMALIAARPVRQPGGAEIGLAIWGPLEARLQRVDRMILGGLIDGVWPAQTTTDPWLSRPMKAGLGLEPPERRIGLSAHDFTQALGAPEVILCRALKRGGAPTVPSRWLQRLIAVIGPDAAKALRARAKPILDWAALLDRPSAPPRPITRPVPTPPVARRPIQLSVTEIETWIRDPYAIYARHVLKLDPLDPIGQVPDAAARGTIVHAVLADFVAGAATAADLADLARFQAIADAKLDAIAAFPGLAALWRARLAGIGRWFTASEPTRYGQPVQRVTEIKGGLAIAEHFTLNGRADRLDRLADGALVIVDYKTGLPPSSKQVTALLAPQLPLEAAMASAGGFGADFKGATIAGLVHVHLSGAGEGGRWIEVKLGSAKDAELSFDDLATEARARLAQLVARYRQPGQGYASRPRIAFERRLDGPYDHLARVAEWSLGGADDGEGDL